MSLSDSLNPPGEAGRRQHAAGGYDPLAAYDAATGQTSVPPGEYTGTISGRLTTTRGGKTAYRLTLEIADGPHAGHRVFRTFTFDSPAAANVAKAMLAPLGLDNSAALRAPYPRDGTTVTAVVLVGAQVRPDGTPGNDVLRITPVGVRPTPPNPNAVDPTAVTTTGGEPQ